MKGAGAGSRIAGRGSLLRALRRLIRRLDRFAQHRAATAEELAWAANLADGLNAAWTAALNSPSAAASLRAVDERRRIASKTGPRARCTVATNTDDLFGGRR